MHFFFIDDSRQKKPNRPKMGEMVAVGGFAVLAKMVKPLEHDLDVLCSNFGFPDGEIFKWSPGKEHWMKTKLVGEARRNFQIEVLATLSKYECRALFIAEDVKCAPADGGDSHELDLAKLLIERADWFFAKNQTSGIIIVDRHGGDHKDEESFLADCFDTLRGGTRFLKPANIVMSVMSLPSKLSRLLQAADLITGATLSYVCGEKMYSPEIAEHIKPLLIRESSRVGGVGVKLHPYLKYGNFYHWLFGDTHYHSGNVGYPMPIPKIAFSKSIENY